MPRRRAAGALPICSLTYEQQIYTTITTQRVDRSSITITITILYITTTSYTVG